MRYLKVIINGLAIFSLMLNISCSDNGMDSKTVDYKYNQVDRFGIPALNTVFNHPEAFSKKNYNTSGPESDIANYNDQFITVLGAVANGDPAGTASALLPDELPINLSSSESNFALLDGRKLSDDATDIALSVVIGAGLSFLHSDNVDANDKAFSSTFPFLAEPN